MAADDTVLIELDRAEVDMILNANWTYRQALITACREALESERIYAESEAARLPAATLPELGFSHIGECRHCRQPITIAKWTHVSGGDWPSGNEANADHNPMPDPTTIQEWGGE